MRVALLIPLAALGALALIAGGIATGFKLDDDRRARSGGAAAPPATRRPLMAVEEINRTLPAGFRATIVAEGLPFSTAMAIAKDGTTFVGVQLEEGKAAVYAYPVIENGRELGAPVTFADGFSQVTGIFLRGNEAYVASRGSLSLLEDRNHDLVADARRTLLADLPAEFPVHANNGMAIGPDGMLYFGVGSTCNACFEQHPLAASIVRCSADGAGCAPFARGLRNVFDLAFHPDDGALFAADNGAEAIGGATVEIEEEIDVVVEGGDYGWPLCWGKSKGLNCTGSLPALVEIQPHAAPAGLAFYTGTSFPPEYRNNLFVALWGDTGRSVLRVVTRRRKDGSYTAEKSDFVRMNRPVDVLTAPDGSLFVLDSDAYRIYRISYRAP